MRFFAMSALALPAITFAMPAMVARDVDSQADAVIQEYLSAANSTVSQITIFGCEIVSCVEALAPLIAACALAAAYEGKDTSKDATCVADAYQDLTPSKKPAECNHCYK